MEEADSLLVFTLDGHKYALPLDVVERVIRLVEITPLPDAPDVVLGAINLHGRIIPVLNLRKRFRLPEPEPSLSDHLIIARTPKRSVAIVADTVRDVCGFQERDRIDSRLILPDMEYLAGVIRLDDGMILIHNLAKFLSLDEEESLERAIDRPSP